MNALPCTSRLFFSAFAAAAILSAAPPVSADCRVLNVPRLASKPAADQTWVGDRGLDLARGGLSWLGRFNQNSNHAGPPKPPGPKCKCGVPGTGGENPAGWLLGIIVGAALWRWRSRARA